MVIMNALTATTASAHRYRPRVNSPYGVDFRAGRGNPPLPPKKVVAIVTIGSRFVTQPRLRAVVPQLSHQATLVTAESCHRRDKT
ncbi:hypothetical protein ACQEU6_30685 [Spirillospora sp. CA-108201]